MLAGCTNLPAATGASPAGAPALLASEYRPEAARREGGSVVVGDWESPTNLAPLFNDEAPAAEIDSLLYSGLTRRDDRLRPMPDLAVRLPTLKNGGVAWDRAARRMTVSYQLRAGLRWSDGQPLTAADVAFTWKAIQHAGAQAAGLDAYQDISDVQVQDSLRFKIVLSRIYPEYLDLFPAVLPEHRLATLPLDQIALDRSWARPDVVSGPYKIAELVADNHITLVRNDAWSEGRPGRRPHLDSIVFRVYPEVGQLLEAARAGQVDVALEVPDTELASIANLGSSSLQRRPALAYEQVSFNQADPNPETGKSPPWAGDPVLLQALRTSVDRAAMVRSLFKDQVPVARSPISSVLEDFHDADPGLAFDQSAANQSLDRDGWLMGADGVRVKNGRRLSFSLLTALGDPVRTAVRDDLILEWRKVGAQVTPQDVHTGQMFSGYAEGGLLERGRFQAALWTWNTGVDPDGVYPLEHSSQIPTEANQGAGSNFSRVQNGEIDRSLSRGRQTLVLGERVQAYAAFERAYARSGAELPLFERVQVVVSAQRLHNVLANPGPATTLWNASDWWVS